MQIWCKASLSSGLRETARLPDLESRTRATSVITTTERPSSCALTALSVAMGDFTAVRGERDGWIILLPRWPFANSTWTAARETARHEKLERQFESTGRPLSFPED